MRPIGMGQLGRYLAGLLGRVMQQAQMAERSQIIQSLIEIVLVELRQGQHFGHRLALGPAHGRQTRALMGDPRQDQK